jgi:hypothetical protein
VADLDLAGHVLVEVGAGLVEPTMSTRLPRAVSLVVMASSAATEEASQMCAALMSITTLWGSSV